MARKFSTKLRATAHDNQFVGRTARPWEDVMERFIEDVRIWAESLAVAVVATAVGLGLFAAFLTLVDMSYGR